MSQSAENEKKDSNHNWAAFIMLLILGYELFRKKEELHHSPVEAPLPATEDQTSKTIPPVTPKSEGAATITDKSSLWKNKLSELNSQTNEYFRALVTSAWYYSAGLLVVVGWIFTSLKNATEISEAFQAKELLTRYPSLSYPVLALFLVNIMYLALTASVGYALIAGHMQIHWIYKTCGLKDHPEVLTRFPKLFSVLSGSTICVPIAISVTIFLRFPSWIAEISSPGKHAIELTFAVLAIYLVLTLAAIVLGLHKLHDLSKQLSREDVPTIHID